MVQLSKNWGMGLPRIVIVISWVRQATAAARDCDCGLGEARESEQQRESSRDPSQEGFEKGQDRRAILSSIEGLE